MRMSDHRGPQLGGALPWSTRREDRDTATSPRVEGGDIAEQFEDAPTEADRVVNLDDPGAPDAAPPETNGTTEGDR